MFNFFRKKTKSADEILADRIIDAIDAVGPDDRAFEEPIGTRMHDVAWRLGNVHLRLYDYYPISVRVFIDGAVVDIGYEQESRVGEALSKHWRVVKEIRAQKINAKRLLEVARAHDKLRLEE